MSVYKKYLIFLIVASLCIRCFFAWYLELSNEETYYWSYALFTDYSHVDNPPMIGWLIQFFTHHLEYENPFFIRLISLLVGTLNSILIFMIGHRIKNEKTGWYGALLYNLSIYGLMSVGVSVSPEVPQSFLYLLILFLLLPLFEDKNIKPIHRFKMVLIGLLIGFGILCKYNSLFLWIGILVYIFLFQRNWLKKYSLYMSIFMTLICCIPILWWNIENRYIGFYRVENIPSLSGDTNSWLFFEKWFWQMIYYNPVNLLLVFLGFIHVCIKGNIPKYAVGLFLCLCIPMWASFSILSFFKNISLQWILVAGLPLLLIAASYMADMKPKTTKIMLGISSSFMILFLFTGITTRAYPFFEKNSDSENPLSIFKFYGWEQLNEKFGILREKHLKEKTMDSSCSILCSKWYQASTMDYYVARPNHTGVKTIGFIKATFEYALISNKRGGFKQGEDFYYITSTKNFENPNTLYTHYFKKIVVSDTISILKNQKIINQYIVYCMYDLKEIPTL